MREYGSEFASIILPDNYFDDLKRFGYCTFIRSGREALAFAARCCVVEHPMVLLPAYCCWSMCAPFENNGWEIVYYRLSFDLQVDLVYLESLLKQYRPNAILTMNYYGIAPTDDAVDLVKRLSPDCQIIEDFSHCTFSLETIFNPGVDFYVSSIRKSVGVCDGAIVISRLPSFLANVCTIESADDDFANLRWHAQTEKDTYDYAQSPELKENFRKKLGNAEECLNRFDSIYAISSLGLKMLSTVNGSRIASVRRKNLKHLMECISGFPYIKLFPRMSRALIGAPFSLPILSGQRDELQCNLAQRGVYAPVLWPIPELAEATCPVSASISKHLLSIPIDQRYDFEDIEEIGKIIMQTLKDLYV